MDDIVTRPTVVERYLPTYIMAPSEEERFQPSQARAIAEAVVQAELEGQSYEEEAAKEWSNAVCEKVRAQVTEQLNMPRYKVVVQCTVGELKDQGVRIASRCLWDTANDNYASVSYKNQSLWASVLVFALYAE